jgi:hypothetical protein
MPSFLETVPLNEYNIPDEVRAPFRLCHSAVAPADARRSGHTARCWEKTSVCRDYKRTGTHMLQRMISSCSPTSVFPSSWPSDLLEARRKLTCISSLNTVRIPMGYWSWVDPEWYEP